MIKLSVRKIFSTKFKNCRAVEVVGIKALDNVPSEYLQGYPNCFKHEDRLIINESKNKTIIIKTGEKYQEEEMNDIIKTINKCGDRLKKINNKIRNSFQSKPRAIRI